MSVSMCDLGAAIVKPGLGATFFRLFTNSFTTASSLGLNTTAQLLQEGLGPLLRVLPGVLPHALHQVEVGTLLIRETSHVTQLRNQEDWTTHATPLLSQFWH